MDLFPPSFHSSANFIIFSVFSIHLIRFRSSANLRTFAVASQRILSPLESSTPTKDPQISSPTNSNRAPSLLISELQICKNPFRSTLLLSVGLNPLSSLLEDIAFRLEVGRCLTVQLIQFPLRQDEIVAGALVVVQRDRSTADRIDSLGWIGIVCV